MAIEETEYDSEVFEGEEAPVKKGPFARYWERVGGGSFSISVLIHAVFVVIALLIIWKTTGDDGKQPEIDFLSGGGGGTEGNTQIHEKKARMMVNRAPAMKIASAAAGTIVIPDTHSTIADFSAVSINSGMMSGTPGTGGGFGGGNGTGHGKGNGPGFGPGNAPGFTANFMGMLSKGNNIIFCIDTSGSMKTNLSPEGIAAVRRELKRVITDMPPATNFNVICFGTSADIFKPKSVAATQENKNEVLRFLEGYYGGASADFGRTRTERYGRAGKDSQGIEYVPLMPDDVAELRGTEGGSRVDLAMVAAFERKPSTLFVLSDGAPGTKHAGDNGPMEHDEIIKMIYEKYKTLMGETSKLAVNTISIDSNTDEGREGTKFMRKLANKFGGKHKEVKANKLKELKESKDEKAK
ncbi:MAG TPA: hypothetical protein VHM91_11640 [Verrucomicrobiales bacterium]|nr:hypothetical protein [Verrucomicrobiales bacterium]